MKRIRKISQNPIAILLVLFNFIVVSCNRGDLSDMDKEDLSVRPGNSKSFYSREKIDGESLFKQVFFLQGGEQNILNELPYYSANILNIEKLSSSQKEDRIKFVNEITNIIKQNKPDYFIKFQRTIANDDPYEIANVLRDGSREILEATEKSSYAILFQRAKKIYEQKYSAKEITNQEDFDKIKDEIAKEMNLNSNISNYESDQCLTVAAVVAAVALETLAVANMIAYLSVFVKVKGKFWSLTEARERSSLMNEEIVLKLIENY